MWLWDMDGLMKGQAWDSLKLNKFPDRMAVVAQDIALNGMTWLVGALAADKHRSVSASIRTGDSERPAPAESVQLWQVLDWMQPTLREHVHRAMLYIGNSMS
jgi:hypothetical protein